MSAQNKPMEWPGGSIPNFLVSDEGGRLDRVYPRLQAEEPRFAATIQRIAASSQLGMNRRMKDPAPPTAPILLPLTVQNSRLLSRTGTGQSIDVSPTGSPTPIDVHWCVWIAQRMGTAKYL